MKKEIKKILYKHSGIPKPYWKFRLNDLNPNDETLDWYENFGEDSFQTSLLLYCADVNKRIKGKRIAVALLLELANNERIIPPAYYLTKTKFVEYWRQYRFNRTNEDETAYKQGELYKKANLIIFDGIDEIQDKEDRKLVMSFIENMLDRNIPFIFISSHRFNNKLSNKFNIQSLVSKVKEFSIETEIE